MRTRWDDIEVLRAIDGLQEQHGGDPVWLSGREVMNGIAGSWVTEPELISGFAYELDLARNAALLTFEVSDHAAGHRTQNTDFYLQNVRKLALTISGRDRARGRVIQVPLPDPDQDDGHRISYLILGQIAGEIEQQYSRDLAVVFLEESGIILDKIPAPPTADEPCVGLSGAGSATSSTPAPATSCGAPCLPSSPARDGTCATARW